MASDDDGTDFVCSGAELQERMAPYLERDDRGLCHVDVPQLLLDAVVVLKSSGTDMEEILETIEDLWDRVVIAKPN